MELELLKLDVALINFIDPKNRYIKLLSNVDIFPEDVEEVYNNLIKKSNKIFDLDELKSLYKSVIKDKTKEYKDIQDFYKNTFDYNLSHIRI